MSDRIEKKPLEVAAHTDTVLGALRGLTQREITVADAAVATGLPLALAERALIHLGGKLESRIRVTDAGELLFTFGSLDEARSEGRAARALRAARTRLRGVLDRAVAVLTYLLAPNLALACAGNIAALGLVVRELHWLAQVALLPPVAFVGFLVFAFGFLGFVVTQLAPVMCLVVFLLAVTLPVFVLVMAVREDLYGTLIAEVLLVPLCFTLLRMTWRIGKELRAGARHIVSEPALADLRAFFEGVSGFLLGPSAEDATGLDDERRVVAFLRANEGVLTTADLMRLFGVTRDEADRDVTRILADYEGEIEVKEGGALIYVFRALRATDDAPSIEADLRPAWEREVSPPRFFGCEESAARNALVVASLSLLGLWLHPALSLFPTLDCYRAIDFPRAEPPVEALVGLGAWPFVLPLSMLLARAPFHLRARSAYRERTRLYALLARALAGRNGFYVQDEDTRRLVSLGGVVVPEKTTTRGDLFVDFPGLRAELDAAREARRTAEKRTRGAEIVFDTTLVGEEKSP